MGKRRIGVIATFMLAAAACMYLLLPAPRPHQSLPAPKTPPATASPSGPAPATVIPKPNVVWVVLDACRSDHLSCYGYGRATSPVIDQMAKTGVLFENNYAQGLWTKLSVPAYMTGRFFPVSCLDFGGGENVPRAVPPEEKLLPEIFRENGYGTLCVSAHPYISPRSRLYRAFEYSALVPSPDSFPTPTLEQMLPAMEAALDRHAQTQAQAPFFLYVHAMDTHFPHRSTGGWATPGFTSQSIRDGAPVGKTGCVFTPEEQACLADLHDSSILQADHALGRLLNMLERRSLDKNTLFVISSDHGDLLGEDGSTWGHETIADPVLRTPLIMSGPGLPAGRRVSALTRCVDILPTLLDLTGSRTGAVMQGVSLLPAVRGGATPTEEPVFSRAGIYEAGGIFMLIDREHRYELDVEKGAGRLFPASDARGLELAGAAEATAERYRAVMDSRILPLWAAYSSLPRLYRHFDFSKDFDPAWVAPAVAMSGGTNVLPEGADTVDNRWSFSGGTLWAANWSEQAPPLTLTLPMEPGTYQVSVWLNGIKDLLGHAGSSVIVEVNGTPPVEATWTTSLQAASSVYAHEVAQVELTEGPCRLTLRPGVRDYWSAVSGVGLIRIDSGATGNIDGGSGEEHREELKALGYLN